MNKNKKLLTGLAVAAAFCVVILCVFAFSGGGGNNDSSQAALTVITDNSQLPDESVAEPNESESAPAVTTSSVTTTAEAPTTTTTVTTTTAAKTSKTKATSKTTTSAAKPQKQIKQYRFRSQKLLDQHFEKHGSEFGNITKDDYVRMANELINSESESVLSKTEKEDGDTVFFDKKTGYFAVLSTDGYIRTFFIPDQGIKYYNKQ